MKLDVKRISSVTQVNKNIIIDVCEQETSLPVLARRSRRGLIGALQSRPDAGLGKNPQPVFTALTSPSSSQHMSNVVRYLFSAIFQRTSVSRGQLRIQGVATCLYLCMDSCGLLYGSVSKPTVYPRRRGRINEVARRGVPRRAGSGAPISIDNFIKYSV